jgi:hypothetical protein
VSRIEYRFALALIVAVLASPSLDRIAVGASTQPPAAASQSPATQPPQQAQPPQPPTSTPPPQPPTGTQPPQQPTTGTQPPPSTQPTQPPTGTQPQPPTGTQPPTATQPTQPTAGTQTAPPANQSAIDSEGAGALLDRMQIILNAALGNRPADSQAVGTSGVLPGVDSKSKAGKISVDRAALDEILAEVQQLRTMLRVRQ